MAHILFQNFSNTQYTWLVSKLLLIYEVALCRLLAISSTCLSSSSSLHVHRGGVYNHIHSRKYFYSLDTNFPSTFVLMNLYNRLPPCKMYYSMCPRCGCCSCVPHLPFSKCKAHRSWSLFSTNSISSLIMASSSSFSSSLFRESKIKRSRQLLILVLSNGLGVRLLNCFLRNTCACQVTNVYLLC